LIVAVTFSGGVGGQDHVGHRDLATQYSLVQVWLGSTVGMVLSDALAIWVGQALGKRLPERAVKIGAAAIFLAFGLFSLYQGAIELLRT
jgi:putative Ca2+/H+ antiporter (TMEM165/GDT1 family)